jgi:NTE family protein
MDKLERLIFSGGGIRGIAFVGSLMAIKDLYNIEPSQLPALKEIAGTSIGSLVALMVCIGFTIEEMRIFAEETDISDLSTVNGDSLFTTFGMNDGKILYKLANDVLRKKGIPTDITFKSLFEQYKKVLHVVVTDISTVKERMLNVFTYPQMPIIKAVVASMSLPPMFGPVKHYDSLFCDGGLVNSFPIKNFPEKNTLGFRVAWYVDPSPLDNLVTYYTRLLACLQLSTEKEYNSATNSIVIDVGATVLFVSIVKRARMNKFQNYNYKAIDKPFYIFKIIIIRIVIIIL